MASLADCRWPNVGEPYSAGLHDAIEFALDRFDAMGVIACGSILRGNPGLTSDWDIHVIHVMILNQAVAQMVEYPFWEHGCFQPRAKVMLAELAALDADAADLAHQYYVSGAMGGRFDLAHQLAQQTLGVDTFFAWESPLEDVKA